MNNAIHFVPKKELDSSGNLAEFITQCRQLSIWSVNTVFDENEWDVGTQKGQSKTLRAIFTTHENASLGISSDYMSQPFLDFAKAILVYFQTIKPVVNPAVRLMALRCLESSLRKLGKGARPTAISEEILDEAINIAKSSVSLAVAYRAGGQLQLFSEFMRDKGFISLSRKWSHGIKKPSEVGSRISEEALASREKKMPSEAVLRAIGHAFSEATKTEDIFVSSVLALLLCTPERINEVLRLRRNCVVEGDGRFSGKIGLRWPGSKGFDDAVKWLPTQMAPIALEAVENLKKLTAPAREISEWYIHNPNDLFYHEGVVHLRNKEFLTSKEISLILWGENEKKDSTNLWLNEKNIERRSIGKIFEYSRVKFESAVIEMLPNGFPYITGDSSLICTDSVVIFRKNELHSQRGTYMCMVDYADYQSVDNRLGIEGKLSLFESLGYTEDDGSKIKLNSHNLRHYLNTLAQMGGLSSAEIAIFSGRSDVKQNRNYDHMTSDEVQAPVHSSVKAGGVFSIQVANIDNKNLVNRSDFKNLGKINAHTNSYGYCVHNFAAEPCHAYRDCINCQEQVCIKGDIHKEVNIRKLKDETEYLLKNAREALTNEEYGADKWVQHQTKTLNKINEILKIIDNPSVLPGAVISFSDSVPILIAKNVPELVSPQKSLMSRRGRKALK